MAATVETIYEKDKLALPVFVSADEKRPPLL